MLYDLVLAMGAGDLVLLEIAAYDDVHGKHGLLGLKFTIPGCT